MKCGKGRQTILQRNRMIFSKNSQNHKKQDLVASCVMPHFSIFYYGSSVLKMKYVLTEKVLMSKITPYAFSGHHRRASLEFFI